MGFSRQEYWGGLPFPSPGDHPDPWIELGLLHCRQMLYCLSHQGSVLKLNTQKTKIMASGPITPWQIDGETVTDFIFWGSKVTSDGDCSHEIKRHLLLGRKTKTNLDSILKTRDVTLPTKVCLVKAMVFPVVMYGCESWTIKKAERRRIDAFELWHWRRLLKSPLKKKKKRVPWTARRSNQSILKEISPEYSLEGLMLKLKLWYFGHLIGRTDSLGKALMLGKIVGRGRRGRQRMRWLDGITDSMDMSLSKLRDRQGSLVCCSPWSCKESDRIEWLNWTEQILLIRSLVNSNTAFLCHSPSYHRIPSRNLYLFKLV